MIIQESTKPELRNRYYEAKETLQCREWIKALVKYMPHWDHPIIDGERSLTQKQRFLGVIFLPLWGSMNPKSDQGQHNNSTIRIKVCSFYRKFLQTSKDRWTFGGSMTFRFAVRSIFSLESTSKLPLILSCKVGYENQYGSNSYQHRISVNERGETCSYLG